MKLLAPNTAIGTPANSGSPKLQELPITFRIPRAGQRDPYFGLSRSWYYAADADGRITLIRLRDKGKTRGTTLVQSANMLALIGEEAL